MTLKLVFILMSWLALASSQKGGRKPDQVIEIFRHGARAPNGNYDSWPDVEEGQLTPEGMREHYQLGKALSEKYAHLIEEGYNSKDFYAVSNDVQRCVESALVHLTSLFRGKPSTLKGKSSPQEGYQQELMEKITKFISKDENRGEIALVYVGTVDQSTQLIFQGNGPHNCPNLGFWGSQNYYNYEAQMAWGTFLGTIEKVNSQLPSYQQIHDIGSLVLSYDAIIAAIYDKRTPPGDIKDKMLIKELEFANAFFIYHLEQGSKIQRQLSSFHTLDAVLKEMANFREGKNPKKMVFFSGHDKNLYAVLAAFGVVNRDCLLANYDNLVKVQKLKHTQCYYPYFASNLVFEFYNDPTEPYVQFYYNDVLIPLCNGQESCSYNDFIKFVGSATGNLNGGKYFKQCTDNPYVVIQEMERRETETEAKMKNPPSNNEKNQDCETSKDSKPSENIAETKNSQKGDGPRPRPRPNPNPNSKKNPPENEKTPSVIHQKNVDNENTSKEISEPNDHPGDNENPNRNDLNSNPQTNSEKKENDFHIKNNSPAEQNDKGAKALIQSGGEKSIISIVVIFIFAFGSLLVFLRVLLNRRKYLHMAEPEHELELEHEGEASSSLEIA